MKNTVGRYKLRLKPKLLRKKLLRKWLSGLLHTVHVHVKLEEFEATETQWSVKIIAEMWLVTSFGMKH